MHEAAIARRLVGEALERMEGGPGRVTAATGARLHVRVLEPGARGGELPSLRRRHAHRGPGRAGLRALSGRRGGLTCASAARDDLSGCAAILDNPRRIQGHHEV